MKHIPWLGLICEGGWEGPSARRVEEGAVIQPPPSTDGTLWPPAAGYEPTLWVHPNNHVVALRINWPVMWVRGAEGDRAVGQIGGPPAVRTCLWSLGVRSWSPQESSLRLFGYPRGWFPDLDEVLLGKSNTLKNLGLYEEVDE